jgi:hypothetical protein
MLRDCTQIAGKELFAVGESSRLVLEHGQPAETACDVRHPRPIAAPGSHHEVYVVRDCVRRRDITDRTVSPEIETLLDPESGAKLVLDGNVPAGIDRDGDAQHVVGEVRCRIVISSCEENAPAGKRAQLHTTRLADRSWAHVTCTPSVTQKTARAARARHMA